MVRSQRAPSVARCYVYREIDSDSQRFVQSPSKLPAHAGRLQGQLLPDLGDLLISFHSLAKDAGFEIRPYKTTARVSGCLGGAVG